MAKQKIVVKVAITDNKKRSKALKIAVSICGVESVSLQGEDKNQILVTGEGMDSVELVKLLRKNIGYTDLVSAGPADDDEKPTEVEEVVATSQSSNGSVPHHVYPYYYCTPAYPICEFSQTNPGCSIM